MTYEEYKISSESEKKAREKELNDFSELVVQNGIPLGLKKYARLADNGICFDILDMSCALKYRELLENFLSSRICHVDWFVNHTIRYELMELNNVIDIKYKENKMKTSKEMQLKILDKMKSNIDNNLPVCNGIEYYSYRTQKWHTPEAIDFENLEYRIKPKTIIVNGVEIPKPLDISDVSSGIRYYKVSDSVFLYCSASADEITYGKFKFIYKTKEEAIEASKALFGIE